MLCIACGQVTESVPCSRCQGEPRLDGVWSLLEVLGQGANGTTYRAVDPGGRVVAAKESSVKVTDPAKVRELARREARVLRQLDHPGVPAFVDEIWHESGRSRSLFVLQEHVDGEDLQRSLARTRYDEDGVLAVMEELCEILAYLHDRRPPIVHRDLKPSNVMRRRDGRLVLVDFGSVRDALKDRDLGGSTVAGTFGFMAPEQFGGDASPASDLYALGALAVALLTRQDPAKLQRADRRLAWRELTVVSAPTAALIDALLALDPAERPASARAVADQIAQIRSTADEPEVMPAAAPMRRVLKRPESAAPQVTFAERAPAVEPAPFHQPPVVYQSAQPAKAVVGNWLFVALSVLAAAGGVAVLAVGAVLVLALTAVSPAPPTLAPSPWPSMPAEALSGLPAEPICRASMSGDGVVSVTDCPAPLVSQAEAWATSHLRQGTDEQVITFSPQPAHKFLVWGESEFVIESTNLVYEEVEGLKATSKVSPAYPDEALDQPLAPIRCQATIDVGADGEPDRVVVSECPTVFHPTTRDAIAGWRWDTQRPAKAEVGVTYKVGKTFKGQK
jgi:hypothetical protein